MPSISTRPVVGKSMAPQRLSRVVLPQPLRPTMETNSPLRTSNETLSSARTLVPFAAYSFVTPASWMTAKFQDTPAIDLYSGIAGASRSLAGAAAFPRKRYDHRHRSTQAKGDRKEMYDD